MDELARKYAETSRPSVQSGSGSDQPSPRWNVGQLEHAKNALFHFLGLCRRFVKAALEVGLTTFPGHVDGPHRIGHDDELRGLEQCPDGAMLTFMAKYQTVRWT